MKITGSTVAMASSHSYHSFTFVESMTMQARASADLPGAILELPQDGESKSYLNDMKEYEKEQKVELKKRQEENAQKSMQQLLQNTQKAEKTSEGSDDISDQYKLKLELIKRMFELLKRSQGISEKDIQKMDKEGVLDLRSSSFRSSFSAGLSVSTGITVSVADGKGGNVASQGSGSLWTRVTPTSGFYEESESTSFATTGMVQTADGRNISNLFGFERYYVDCKADCT